MSRTDRTDPLDGVRPGGRRSFWLREVLAAEPAALAADVAAPPLRGRATADIAILGGGYTGLWTALRLTELAPGARIAVVEKDICGGGPSGRNGGFVTGWWDEMPGLIARFGETEALRTAEAVDAGIDEIGAFTAANGIDAWWTPNGFLSVSAAPAQDGSWSEATDACARLGLGDRWQALAAEEVATLLRSPVFRGGAFMPKAATVQPAALARGLRRVALERGVVIHERTKVDSFERGVVTTSSAEGAGELVADQVIVALNAWAAGWPAFGRRLVTWSSYIVLTEPIPDRLAEIGWTGGEGIADSRFTLHYGRTTPDGRIALGGGGGRAGFGGRIGRAFTHDAGAARHAAEGLRRWFPSLAGVRIEDAWGGPIDITDDHRPWFGTLPGGRVHFGVGYSGNGVAPSVLGGRILAALALGPGSDDQAASLPITTPSATPRAFPPEPLRYVGARAFREAIARRERAEEAGRRPNRLMREISRMPRRLGYHLGP
ncbi:MAG TPA: FAD-binding oxidoreductase, partial [Candidatus Limnocylindrales bacterium]|nr:FAD-binding oxidoreductase [Candidatus Limnocylindrales bacterium]